MARRTDITITWTCDVCGATEPEVDGYSPNGWKQVAHTLASAQLGNVAAQHLCGNCSTSLHLLLTNRLGDEGDMEQAWDEGYTTGQQAASGTYGDGTEAPRNPYLTDQGATQ